MESYENLSAGEKASVAPMDKLSSMGIEASREMAAWLWNHRVAAVGTDCPAVEAFPFNFMDEERCITALCRCWACRSGNCSSSPRWPGIAPLTGAMNLWLSQRP